MADRPVLAVLPLPVPVDVAAAVMTALAEVWEDRHGQTLTMGGDLATEDTPWGKALVLREPEPVAEASPDQVHDVCRDQWCDRPECAERGRTAHRRARRETDGG